MKNPEDNELAERLLAEQNFTGAVIAGAAAAFLAAVAYGIAVETWPFSYGFAAAGVGIATGVSVQFIGRGISPKFAVLAAVYTIAGCVFGNLFVKIVNIARTTATSPIEVFQNSSLPALARWSVAGLSMIHLVFWFVAVWFAVFLATRPLSRRERLAIGKYESRH